jgi:hypothetical protein
MPVWVWKIYITIEFERNSPILNKKIPEGSRRDMNIGLQIN